MPRYAEGVYTTVEESELLNHTQSGWVLVQVLTVYTPVPLHAGEMSAEQRKDLQIHDRQPWGMPVGQPFTEALAKRMHFLLRLAPESALAGAKQQLDRARKDEQMLVARCGKAVEDLQAAQTEKNKLLERVAGLERCERQLVEERVIKRRLEADIGELRKAIGELRFKEILKRES